MSRSIKSVFKPNFAHAMAMFAATSVLPSFAFGLTMAAIVGFDAKVVAFSAASLKVSSSTQAGFFKKPILFTQVVSITRIASVLIRNVAIKNYFHCQAENC